MTWLAIALGFIALSCIASPLIGIGIYRANREIERNIGAHYPGAANDDDVLDYLRVVRS